MTKQFPNLNGLRFFAAFIVLLCHIEATKKMEGFSSLYSLRFFAISSQLAVTFFFVLSGFLISYFLIINFDHSKRKEKIFGFYIKRILRIWPLYYILVILVFFVLSRISLFQLSINGSDGANLHKRFIYYLFFLPNTGEFKFGSQMYIGQVW